jgi:nucleoside-diphosphate-sugar epimerase
MLGSGGSGKASSDIDDLIDLYMLALDRAPGGSMLHGVRTDCAGRDLVTSGKQISWRAGANRIVISYGNAPELAAADKPLSVNKRLASNKTQQLLSWSPKRHDILEDTERGSYNTSANEAQNIH